MNHITFPYLGLDFHLNETVSIFGFKIYWYAIIIALGMLVAIALASFEFKKRGYTGDDLADFVLFGIPLGILGARLYYVIFDWSYYARNIGDIFAIWKGGLAIYGGVIAGCIVAIVYTRVKKIPFLWFADVATRGLFIAQSIGRWGNFVNAEAFGSLTSLPWGMVVEGAGVKPYSPFGPCHPTFLYESLWNLTGFIISYFIIYRLLKTDGYAFAYYLIWYGAGRFMIEGLRTDSLWLIKDVVRVSQLVAFVSVIGGIAVLFYIENRKKKAKNIPDGK
ncbi:MAG: prolipoprotein diacylglyceryl transferase [Clostridia bacterium]|nr:prolipoprotein diacylglyceryl transferase [Clostridia bacterium]